MAFQTSHDNKSYVYVLGNKKDTEKNGASVKFFRDETSLLQSFLRFWIDLKPTIISGWNIDQFDTPYLYNRITKFLVRSLLMLYHLFSKLDIIRTKRSIE